ncbi:MAG: NUDIX domain-containing protein [Verrucomicrobia bacterium]|nr:NUDIX domain-containing protein [Verrucomicrobiota bacterium]
MPPESKSRFRLNVAGILRDVHGRILICERLGRRGSWQFPQGGVDPGESLQGALHRELYEEIGVGPEQIELRNQSGPYRYEFDGIVVKGFHGKDQHFFLVHYHGDENAIRLDMPNPEFQAFRWILPESFDLRWLPPMKRPMYQQAFADLLWIELK